MLSPSSVSSFRYAGLKACTTTATTLLALRDLRGHRPQLRVQLEAEVRRPVAQRADEDARLVRRKRGRVSAERREAAVLAQVLLDVRQVERRHRGAAAGEVSPDGRQGFRAREIAHQRDEPVVGLESLHVREPFLGCQVAVLKPAAVGRAHQLRVRRLPGQPPAGGLRRRVLNARPVHVDGVEDVLEPQDVGRRELEAVRLRQEIHDRAHVAAVERVARLDLLVRRENLVDRRRGGQPGRPRAAEEARDELGPIGRELEERLVHQVQVEVAAPDVHDERHRRLQRGDVGEVLFGADAHVGAIGPGFCGFGDKVGDDVLEPALVRQQVVGLKRAGALGEFGDDAPVLLVGQPRRRIRRADRKGRCDNEREDRDPAQESDDVTAFRPCRDQARSISLWCTLSGAYDTQSRSAGFPSCCRIHGLRLTLCRHHAERRRSSRRRAEGRLRSGARHRRERRCALPHPPSARERRHLCRSGPAAVCAESLRRAPAQGRARFAARHSRVSARPPPLQGLRQPDGLGPDGQARCGVRARHACV